VGWNLCRSGWVTFHLFNLCGYVGVPLLSKDQKCESAIGTRLLIFQPCESVTYPSKWEGLKFNHRMEIKRESRQSPDRDSVPISRSELRDLLTKPSLSGIPLLVLGNKINKSEAISTQALMDQLGLESINEREVCCYMISCKDCKHGRCH